MKSEVEYSGLSESEVLASRERYGENILTPRLVRLCGNCFWKSFPIRLFVFF